MRKFIAILICAFGITGYAVSQQQLATQAVAPTVNMQSVNNSSMMSSGSMYSSDIQEVGAQNPAAARGPRKNPPATGGSGYDPKTPTVDGPIGDALLPLMLMALAFVGYTAIKRRKAEKA